MKKIKLAVPQLTIAAFVCVCSSLIIGAPAGYTKIWEDTFDGSSLNTANWTVGLRDPGTGDMVPGAIGQYLLNNSYAGYITPEDVWVSNGSLYLQNQKRTYQGTSPAGTYNYTTGWIISMHKVHFNKGYLEMRAQLPSGDKVWPAIWLIAEDLVWGPEWDLWEYFGYRPDYGYDVMMQALAYGTYPNIYWLGSPILGYDAAYDCETWHTYGWEWTAEYAKWYYDGVEVYTMPNTIGSNWPNEEMYIVLNNGVRTDSPDTNTTWPNQVVIDSIQLYQNNQPPLNWTKIDDRDAMVSYDASWGQWNGNPGYLNTETFCETTGGTATFSFTGTQARYYGFRRNDLGYADLYVDGVYQMSVDCYSSISQYNIRLYESPVLPYGAHTLSVVVAGIRNPASSGTEVIVDAFDFRGEAPALEMYVNNITMGYRKAGKNYYGRATVSIKDQTGANVEGATVYGNWSGAVSGPDSGITGTDGTVLIESPGKRNGGTFTFTVTDVVKSGFVYNPSLNIVSSGSITVP